MSFSQPFALVALGAVPLLLVLWIRNERLRRASASRFSTPTLLPNLVPRRPGRLRYVPLTLLLLALTAMIVGVARPHANLSVPRKEATVVLAIDVSRSMTATDVRPSRLDAARAAGDAFLARVPSSYAVALVAFGSRAFLAVPPTTDHALVRQGLSDLTAGEGTAIGDAILLAARVGQRQRPIEGVVPPTSVLLISDGARDGGLTPPLTAARRAKALHVAVSTVLVGTPNGVVTTRLLGGYSERIRVPPSPGTLQQVARTTGGEFFRARTSAALSDVYRKLATRVGHRTVNREITDFFAGGAIAVLLAAGLLSAFWFRSVVP
ncbi:MAG TPA: VWA domain-containing protein [Gaiellaceae bacterium]|nr:VWA domain-containing protein [Gaiellaceae bacterium]